MEASGKRTLDSDNLSSFGFFFLDSQFDNANAYRN